MADQRMFKKVSILTVLAILAILSVLVLWPIAGPIVTGLILSYIFYPLYTKVLDVVKSKNVAALLIVSVVIILICLPLWLILPKVVSQVFDIYLYLQKVDALSFVRNLFPALTGTEFLAELSTSLNSFITNSAGIIFRSVSDIMLNLPIFLLKTAVVFFVFFFGMRDSEELKRYSMSISPFSKSTEKELSKKFKAITNAVIYGFIIIGIFQGILTGVGLYLFGLRNVFILTIFATIAAIIPVVGSWLVWFPAAIYLLTVGQIFSGIGLMLYGLLIVSTADNFIRPYLVARKIKISSGIILVGMIGGLMFFGVLGFIIGPLALTYLLLVLDAYRSKNFKSLFSNKGK